MSLDRASACSIPISPSVRPYCVKYQFEKLNFPRDMTPVSSTFVSSFNTPSSSPAVVVIILNVDAGGYKPSITRLNRGRFGSVRTSDRDDKSDVVFSRTNSSISFGSLNTNRFGSKEGAE